MVSEVLEEQVSILFGQLSDFVLSLSQEAYVKPLEVFQMASLGQHVRHSLEFCGCLLEGADVSSLDGVNYDARKRDERLETDPQFAYPAIQRLQEGLLRLIQAPDRPIYFVMEQVGKKIQLRSSIYRECAYTTDHLVHHMAILRMGVIQAMPEVHLPESFGVAHSTIAYKEQRKDTVIN